ncbi:hypothetical protein [Nocardioides mesophilus]|uniref:Uncharacterized protein n=1 Tax=Nocardioides mesophilus TaxID=433659 RepID=A0A7G9R8L5_9ACTN|nr:hypothetical protein [Nocardioides mesophilus]QNN51940.1 hypothetical protein H9L09_15630 [Nocardioides mesophilus]
MPTALLVAAAVAAVEALLLAVYGVAELVALSGDRLTMGLSTSVFFLGYAAGLAFCAWAVTRGSSWARAPIVLAQLIQLGVAWSFRGGSSTPLSVLLAVLALVVLAGLLHPASIAALDDAER